MPTSSFLTLSLKIDQTINYNLKAIELRNFNSFILRITIPITCSSCDLTSKSCHRYSNSIIIRKQMYRQAPPFFSKMSKFSHSKLQFIEFSYNTSVAFPVSLLFFIIRDHNKDGIISDMWTALHLCDPKHVRFCINLPFIHTLNVTHIYVHIFFVVLFMQIPALPFYLLCIPKGNLIYGHTAQHILRVSCTPGRLLNGKRHIETLGQHSTSHRIWYKL